MEDAMRYWLGCCLWLCVQCAVAATPVHIITVEEAPTNFMQEGELTGFVTDVVLRLKQDLAIAGQVELVPTARALKMMAEEPYTLLFTAGINRERLQQGMQFVGPVVSRNQVVWKRREDHWRINSIDDIKTLGLVVPTWASWTSPMCFAPRRGAT
jgi:ABC-type amino acid transport substrate-binding protein